MKEILGKLKSDFEFFTGESYTGLVKSIGMGFASRLSEFNSKLRFVEKQAFVSTADEAYLTLHTGHLLSPEPPVPAEGYIVFFGELGHYDTRGAEISDDKSTYAVLANIEISEVTFSEPATVSNGVVTLPPNLEVPSCKCTANGIPVVASSSKLGFTFPSLAISEGETVTIKVMISYPVPVLCIADGAIGNRDFNRKLAIKTTFGGLDSDVGVLSIVGGKDREDLETYRARALKFLAVPQAPFSAAAISEYIQQNIPTIKYAWVKGGEFVEGKVAVYLLNYNLNITSDETSKALELVQDIRPANVKADDITANAPRIISINVEIRDLLPADVTMRNEVKKNIEYLFATDLFEAGITKSNIESVVYRTVNGTQRVESFTVVSGECIKATGFFYKLGNVIFS